MANMMGPEDMWWSRTARQERYFNNLDIRDWADGILSDPDVAQDVSTDSSIQQYATWPTGGGDVDCELWRIDDYSFTPCAPSTQYKLAIHSKLYGSRYYQLDPDETEPYNCNAEWDILKNQFRIIARDDMLTYLRTSPVDATAMLTRKEVEVAFRKIVRDYSKPDNWRSTGRAAIKASRVSALDTLDQMLDADNDA